MGSSERTLKVAVVDDEQENRAQLAAMVERFGREFGIDVTVHVYDDGSALLETGAREDIFLLDIEMKAVDGMKCARRLRSDNVSAPIIFVTNLAQYAVKGYEVSALDFIVKPVQYASFAFKFRRAVEAALECQRKMLTLKSGSGIRRVDTGELLYVEVRGHKVTYHTEREDIETWGTMREAVRGLEGCGFELCNACYLVNLSKVMRIDGDTVVVGEAELKMSRGKRREFVDAVTRQLG